MIRSSSMIRAAAPLLLALLARPAAAQADGDTWTDPTLDAAVKDADLIILGECTFVAQGGGAAYKVVKTFKGTPPEGGKAVVVIGLVSPEQRPDEGRSVEAGDKAYLLLRGQPGAQALSVPTPTFGRFPILDFGGKPVVVGAFSDTYVRVPVAPPRWERILEALVRGKADDALLQDVRALLAAKDADPSDVYAALEVLALFGQEADRAAVTALLADPRFADPRRYRVRASAATVLGRLGGPASVDRLLALIETDEVPAVKSAAATALGPVLSALRTSDAATVERAATKLAALAHTAPAEAIRPGSASDRRKNEVEGVLDALLKCLGNVRARAGIAPALAALERVDDLDAVMAGLSYFSALGDASQAGAIAARMRPQGAEDVYFNPMFARTLEGLTGQQLGNDREAWLRWARERGQLPPGHDAPLGPPAPPQEGR